MVARRLRIFPRSGNGNGLALWIIEKDGQEAGEDFIAQKIVVTFDHATQSVDLKFQDPEKSPVTIPKEFFHVLCKKDNEGFSLRSAEEAAQEAHKVTQHIKEDDKRHAFKRQTLKSWDDIRVNLRRQSVEISEDYPYFGLRTAFGTDLEASLSVDLAAAFGKVEEAPVLEAKATAGAKFAVDTTFVDADANVQIAAHVVILAKDVQDLKEAFGFELKLEAPNIPGFNFSIPPIKLPKLDLSDSLPELGSFDLDVIPFRLPSLPVVETDLTFDWTQRPKVSLRVENGDITAVTDPTGSGTVKYADKDLAEVTDFALTVGEDGPELEAKITYNAVNITVITDETFDGPQAWPFRIRISGLTTEINPNTLPSSLTATHTFKRVEIRAKSDPALVIAFAGTVKTVTVWDQRKIKSTSTTVEKLKLIEPYPIELIKQAINAAGDAIRLIGRIPTPTVPSVGTQFPGADLERVAAVLERLGDMIAAAAVWVAGQTGAALDALVDVAEDVAAFLSKAMAWLQEAAKGGLYYIVIEVRLNPQTYQLQQIILMPARSAAPGEDPVLTKDKDALSISVPKNVQPSLVFDLEHDWIGLVASAGTGAFTLGTDLWLDKKTSSVEAVRDTDATGTRERERLITLTAESTTDNFDIVLLALQDDGLKVLQTYGQENNGDIEYDNGKIAVSLGQTGPLRDLTLGKDNAAEIKLSVEVDKERVLPYLRKLNPAPAGGADDWLSQYVSITPTADIDLSNADKGIVSFPFAVKVVLQKDSFAPEANVTFNFNIRTFKASFDGAEEIVVKGEGEEKYSPFGLDLTVKPDFTKKPANEKKPTEYEQFVLDFSGADVSLRLGDQALMELTYSALSSSGKGLILKISDFKISRAGLDLTAGVTKNPVELAGVAMPFEFTSGEISIAGSQFVGGSVSGAGQLPPDLVGEAKAEIDLSFGSEGNRIVLESGSAKLTKQGDPLYCDNTRFRITVDELGLRFVRDGGYHFFFTVTGAAVFKPREGEFGEGLLKNLRDITIKLNKAPLAGDPRVLLRHIEFFVAIDPAERINVFDIFSMDLRGIGFHPASPAFGGKPALALGGQVSFAEIGDVVKPEIMFHKMWIAPPKSGKVLPQVRFDGLGVDIKIGSTARIAGRAMVVDEKMPSLYNPNVLPDGVTANGFLASGSILVSGLPPLSASMGFLELRNEVESSDPRHAFFVYGQRNKLAQPIPTPIGEMYMREAGFGFGYRYTLAGLAQADQVTTPRDLVKVLDTVSKYQGNLDDFKAWEPTYDNSDLTLALRALITIRRESTNEHWNENAEKLSQNPVLFDVTAALRSDLTFLMTIRAWLCLNYHTWFNWSQAEPNREKPTLRGYMYLSVPREEFLARALSDPEGHIGETPLLPEQLKTAMKKVQWSSTLYIRPGLFHAEYGWPYELKAWFGEPNGDFYLGFSGGLVFRIEDGALLYGLALKARGFAKLEGRAGGSSLGASATARADFQILAKFIAYIATRPASDTFFYGLIRVDVSVRFAVRVWLEFKIFRKRIRLSTGFAIHLTVAIVMETVVTPKVLGGQVRARIGVSAFGRSLALGVGFSFNNGHLRTARARVQRFMTLGLGVEAPASESFTPAPVTSSQANPAETPAPVAEASRLERARANDNEIGQNLEEADQTPMPEESIVGEKITHSNYWAVLLPAGIDADGSERFIMQLIPKDLTGEGLGDIVCPATFYAPPPKDSIETDFLREHGAVEIAPGPAYSIRGRGLNAAVNLHRFKPNSPGEVESIKVTNDAPEPLSVWFHAPITKTEAEETNEDKVLELGGLLHSMFLDQDDSGLVTEPCLKPIELEQERLPADPEAAASVLRAIDRQRENRERGSQPKTVATSKLKAERVSAIEEMRSAVVAAVMKTADEIARYGDRNGNWLEPKKPSEEMTIDARHLGLTFIVSKEDLSNLFVEYEDESNPTPRLARFEIQTDNATAHTNQRGAVELFNPPDRMFAKRDVHLANPIINRRGDKGICLNWDLEPMWRRSASVYDDPEFHLKHYRIERRFEGFREPYIAQFFVKAGAPIDDRNDVVKLIRPDFQLVDDLGIGNIPEDLRDVLLGLAPTEDAGPQDINHAVKTWNRYITTGDEVWISYTIVPVDVAGTEATPIPLEYMIEPPIPKAPPIGMAQLRVNLDGIPDLGTSTYPLWKDRPKSTETSNDRDTSPVSLTLWVSKPLREKLAGESRPAKIDVRVRREKMVPSGTYGSDAVTLAKSRPGRREMSLKRVAEDLDFQIEFAKDAIADIGIPVFVTSQEANSQTLHRDSEPLWGRLTMVDGNSSGDGYLAFVQALAGDYQPENTPHSAAYPIKAGAYATRVFVRPSVHMEHPRTSAIGHQPLQDQGDSKSTEGPWTVCDTVLRVASKSNADDKKPDFLTPALEAPVEEFEYPVRTEFGALDFEDFEDPSAGRMFKLRPKQDADLMQFGSSRQLEKVEDAKGRVGARITWNAHPRTLRAQVGGTFDSVTPEAGEKYRRYLNLIGGFDLFELNPDALPPFEAEGNKKPSLTDDNRADHYAKYAKHIGQINLLPRSMRGLLPKEIEDYKQVEAQYPSTAFTGEWYSAAESLLVWPRRLLRRTLMTSISEALVATLLSNGRPSQVSIQLVSSSWPKPEGVNDQIVTERLKKIVKWDSLGGFGGGLWSNPNGTWRCKEKVSAPQLRQLFLGLYLNLTADDDAFAYGRDKKTGKSNQKAFDNIALEVTALNGNGEKLAQDKVELDLTSALHAVLDDAFSYVQYDAFGDLGQPGQDGYERFRSNLESGKIYRRYEPVFSKVPDTEAQKLLDWMDETQEDVDPYGWFILRRLGLAAGCRLFDTETGEYVIGTEALSRLGYAFRYALERHTHIYGISFGDLGQPFFDVLSQPDGVVQLVSHDSTPQPLTEAREGQLLDDDALALMQIGLRPAPDRWTKTPGLDRLNAEPAKLELITNGLPQTVYVRVYTTGKEPTVERDENDNPVWPKLRAIPGALIDILDLTKGDVSPSRVLLASDLMADRNHLDIAGAVPDWPFDIGLAPQKRACCILRVVNFGRNQAAIDSNYAQLEEALTGVQENLGGEGTLEWEVLEHPPSVRDRQINVAGKPVSHIDPFGQFDPLPASVVHHLTFREYSEGGDPKKSGPLFPTFQHLQAYLPDGMTVPDWIDPKVGRISAETFEEFIVKWLDWGGRFLKHGHGEPTIWQADDGYKSLGALPFSLATIPQPTPWQLAPKADGSIDLLMLEQDRWGKRKRYAVRPYHRYLPYEKAVDEFNAAAQGKPAPVRKPTLSGALPIGKSGPPEDAFVTVDMPRTEPLDKPVILSRKRLLTKVKRINGSETDLGQLELVIARPPDEIMSEANRVAEAGLGFHGIGVAMEREFAHDVWVSRLSRIKFTQDKKITIDPMTPFGPTTLGSFAEGVPLTIGVKDVGKDDMLRLQAVVPDAWMGTFILRASALPYFFRIRAKTFFSAGTVVSEEVQTVFEEGRHVLSIVDKSVLPSASDDKEPVLIGPHWMLEKEKQTQDGQLTLTFVHPLTRFVDCMDEIARQAWFPPEDRDNDVQSNESAMNLFTAPDPVGTYRISIDTHSTTLADGATVRLATSAEIEINPHLTEKAEPQLNPNDVYKPQIVGPRFTPDSSESSVNHHMAEGETFKAERFWTLETTVDLKPDRTSSVVENPFTPPDDGTMNALLWLHSPDHIHLQLSQFNIDNLETKWAKSVPQRKYQIRRNDLSFDERDLLKKEVKVARKDLLKFNALGGTDSLLEYFDKILAANTAADWNAIDLTTYFDPVGFHLFRDHIDGDPYDHIKGQHHPDVQTWVWPQGHVGLDTEERLALCSSEIRFAIFELFHQQDFEKAVLWRKSLRDLWTYLDRQRFYRPRGAAGAFIQAPEVFDTQLFENLPDEPETFVFDAIQHVKAKFDSYVTVAEFEHALEALADRPTIAETIEALGLIADKPVQGFPHTIALPVGVRLRKHLAGLGLPGVTLDLSAPGPDAPADYAILRAPPYSHEFNALRTALQGSPDTADALIEIYAAIAQNQLFGQGRIPTLTVFRGSAAPDSKPFDHITRIDKEPN